MSVFLVTWDINRQKANEGQIRQNLATHLERYHNIRDPGLDAVWFIATSISPHALEAEIRSRLDEGDRVMVTKLVKGGYQGWLAPDVWEWIDARL